MNLRLRYELAFAVLVAGVFVAALAPVAIGIATDSQAVFVATLAVTVVAMLTLGMRLSYRILNGPEKR